MSSSWLSTVLDQEQIEITSKIAERSVNVASMPDRCGHDVENELGGRFLVRYLTPAQLTDFRYGSDRPHWVTPTAISSTDVCSWLALPSPQVPRQHALLLDPCKVGVVRGPCWIRLGQGIEYYLPQGFPQGAIVDIGVIEVR